MRIPLLKHYDACTNVLTLLAFALEGARTYNQLSVNLEQEVTKYVMTSLDVKPLCK